MTIKDLYENLSQFDWGYKANGENIAQENKPFSFIKYKSLSTEKLLKDKCGLCFDLVNYETICFQKEFHMIFAMNNLFNNSFSQYYIESDDISNRHVFLGYMLNDKVYAFEASWNIYKGIHEYNSEMEMLKDYSDVFCKNYHGNNLTIKKYGIITTYDLNIVKLLNTINNNSIVL